ncbi:MAG: ferredoxin [Syntrophales bacterium]|jgi:ferredoxin|nr:ferredoxin [Syntrophales bacterium]MDY0044062.1 ferredoxin [Syntrophales bacterium]
MKVSVDEEVCIGCGLCEEICPEVFELTGDIAVVKIEEDIPEKLVENSREAAESCPVDAIIVEE